MKRVTKQPEPPAFTAWKAKANADWQPRYGDLQNPEKTALHEALLTEQGHVCCYCGRTISRADSHIEHFRPQESYDDRALNYANLHASCIRETSPDKPLHCGHAKGNEFREDLAISPLDDCEQRFMYSRQDGAVYPTFRDDAGATWMADLLRLDISFLRARRAEALKRTFDAAFLASASDEELARLATAYRAPDSTGKITNFGHVLSRFAEQLLGRTVESNSQV